ncbi:MAG: hypothetical protein ACJAUJ_000947 [Salibacteraceae bacterium]|jgi:hypothetical protein
MKYVNLALLFSLLACTSIEKIGDKETSAEEVEKAGNKLMQSKTEPANHQRKIREVESSLQQLGLKGKVSRVSTKGSYEGDGGMLVLYNDVQNFDEQGQLTGTYGFENDEMVNVRYVDYEYENGKLVVEKQWDRAYRYYYDDKNYLETKEWIDNFTKKVNTYSYQYSKEGREISELINGMLLVEKSYDDQQRVSERINYDINNGSFKTRTLFNYNQTGNEEIQLNEAGDTLNIYTYLEENDLLGNLTLWSRIDYNGNGDKTYWAELRYEHDEQKNWISTYSVDKYAQDTIRRDITYFD